MKKIAVLMGGTSSEREVSLVSGKAAVAALKEAGFDVVPVVLDTNSVKGKIPAGVEAAFLALHGGWGEGGGVQAALDKMHLPYTGPGAKASKLAMNKTLTKALLVKTGLPTAEYEILSKGVFTTKLALPVVVKPPSNGSSVGITKVTDPAKLREAIETARGLETSGDVLVEKYIPGREWTVSVVDGQALPVIEIRARNGWYGFAEKYTHGLTEYVFPEDAADAALVKQCQELAVAFFKALGCRGMSRIDLRVTPEGKPYILEANTIPGFTDSSLLPKAAAHAGLTFPQICKKILETAAFDA